MMAIWSAKLRTAFSHSCWWRSKWPRSGRPRSGLPSLATAGLSRSRLPSLATAGLSNFQPVWRASLSSWSHFEHSSTKMGSPDNEPLYSSLCLSIISTCSTSKFHLKMSECSAWGVVMPVANLYAKDCTPCGVSVSCPNCSWWGWARMCFTGSTLRVQPPLHIAQGQGLTF